MAKNPNTIAKRQREVDKKRKAEEKRALRRKKREKTNEPTDTILISLFFADSEAGISCFSFFYLFDNLAQSYLIETFFSLHFFISPRENKTLFSASF